MRRLFILILSLGMFAIAGCGGGNDGADGLVGSLTVTGAQSSSTYTSDVSFTIKYTNPYRTDLVGVPYNYVLYINGVASAPVSGNFSTSGEFTVTYTISKDSVDQSVKCAAQVGNLIASATQTVAAYGTLVISPSTATFDEAIGASLTYTASGGLPPYTFTVTPSVEGIVTYDIGATSVILYRSQLVDGTVSIRVDDSDGNSASATAVLVAPVP